MSAAEAIAAEISEPLTRAEICARYPDEWVVIAAMDYIHPDGLEFRTARVVGHDTTRRAAFDLALPLREYFRPFANLYTGHIAVRPQRPSFILDDETRDAIRYRR
jgi:hypothetical protein